MKNSVQNLAHNIENIDGRRYDLDWLRVIAFGLLIFYHIGMFYVPWGWHVKSQYQIPELTTVMSLINPWRLALLFFISGVAIKFATDKALSLSAFSRSKVWQLGLPIIFGVTVLVMPQTWFELRQSGEFAGSFLDFYSSYLALDQRFSMITPTWNHLWYIVYLLSYIIIIVPFLPLLKRLNESSLVKKAFSSRIFVLILLTIPFTSVEIWLSPNFPVTHSLVGDWANHAHRFGIFLLGIIVAKQAQFWTTVAKLGRLIPFVFATTLFIRFIENTVSYQLSSFLSSELIGAFLAFNGTLYAWSSILGLLWLAMHYLNKDSQLLRYLTGSVFFYYVLHQTVIVTAGFYITPHGLGATMELISLIIITVIACGVGREIVRFWPSFGVLVGVKPDRK